MFDQSASFLSAVFSFPSMPNEESLIGVSKPLPKQLWEAKKVRLLLIYCVFLCCLTCDICKQTACLFPPKIKDNDSWEAVTFSVVFFPSESVADIWLFSRFSTRLQQFDVTNTTATCSSSRPPPPFLLANWKPTLRRVNAQRTQFGFTFLVLF